jgi:hypothetical protein
MIRAESGDEGATQPLAGVARLLLTNIGERKIRTPRVLTGNAPCSLPVTKENYKTRMSARVGTMFTVIRHVSTLA